LFLVSYLDSGQATFPVALQLFPF
jgi:hypothetical protein